MSFVIREFTDSYSPSPSGFGPDGARATMKLKIIRTDPTAAHYGDVVNYLLGSTDVIATNAGRLRRTLPVSHPDIINLVCTRIESIRGIGRPTKVVSTSPLGVAPLPAFAAYSVYEADVAFTPMEWSYLKDSDIKVATSTYYDDDGFGHTYKYVDEYNRYTWWDLEDISETVSAKYGSRYFKTGSGEKPHNTPFPGDFNTRLSRGVVHLRWMRVPYRYLASSNSYIRSFKGTINQNDWLGWKAGTLLYLDARIRRYLPTMPGVYLDDNNVMRIFTNAMMDVEFLFELVERTNADAPTMTNSSFVVAQGHNCLLWHAGGFKSYAAFSIDGANPNSVASWRPIYRSRPFQRLFTDPDANPE